jgi:hypothetical protein
MTHIINNELNYNLEDKLLLVRKKKNFFMRNKINFALLTKTKRRKDAFYTWDNLPYSFLILAPSLKNFHHMKNNLYQLNDGVLIRKQRFFYKKRYHLKPYTNFYCYRLYMKDLLYFFNILELILDYDMTVIGLELNDSVYQVEQLINLFKDFKSDLKFFLNVNDFDFTFLYSEYVTNLNIQCQLLTN